MSFTNRKKLSSLEENIKALEAAEATTKDAKPINENFTEKNDEIDDLKEINESIEAERQKNITPKQDWNEHLEEVQEAGFSAKEIQQFQKHKKLTESELKKIVEFSAKKNNGKRIRSQSAYPQEYFPKLYSLYFSKKLLEIMDNHVKNETVGYIFDYNNRSDFVFKAIVDKIKSDLKTTSSIIKKPEKKD